MDSNLTAEKIAELKRLWAAATPGEWVGELHDLHDGFIDDKGYVRLETPVSEMVGYAKVQDVAFAAEIHNAFPDLISALEAAETEADSEAGHWIEIIRRLDPENLCDVFDGLGVEENLRQWLAARDARLKNEGAAEWLENAAREGGYYERSSEGMMEEAAELRRKGING